MANKAIRVKALEWEHVTDWLEGVIEPACEMVARTPIREYQVIQQNEGYAWRASIGEYGTAFPTLEEAKAACQADFARRVGESVEVDAVKALRDELYQLKLLICGGEDAPGHANTLTLRDADEIIATLRSDETDYSHLQARYDKLEAVAREALQFVEVIEKGGRDDGDEYAATAVAKALRSVVDGGE